MKIRKSLYMQISIIVISISLLLTACSSNHNFLVNDIHKKINFSEATFSEQINVNGHERTSIPLEKILIDTDSDFINGLVWINDNEILLDCIKQIDEKYITKWFIANVNTGVINYLYHYNDNNFFQISNISIEDSVLKISQHNGNYFEFQQGNLVKQLDGSDSQLTACRNLSNNDLIYYSNSDQSIYNQSNGKVLYKFNDISNETSPRLMQLSPDGKKLVFAFVHQEFAAVRTVIVDMETYAVHEIVKKFIMPSYFWINDKLFVLENNNDAENFYSRICYGDNLEYEIRFQYNTYDENLINDPIIDLLVGRGLTQQNIEEITSLGVKIDDIVNIPNQDIQMLLEDRYGKSYEEGFAENNYSLFGFGGNNSIVPIALTYKTGFSKWDSAVILFSMKNNSPLIEPIYHTTDTRYSDFTINSSGTYLAFREYGMTDNTVNNIVFLKLT
ncbi:hypothetical protein [Hydrogenoanaerobacterium sp.]|uniref:hypothetical protein n=1 Tax=Hydrogenoanaerobacterium sp. TaxID=2953763 RepID=UPI002899A448|nr:hypothetical protein [Hydrogenoanaerobacterium sp.]